MTPERAARLRTLLLGAALLAAAALSVADVRQAVVPDSDVATPAVLADAFASRGFAALRAWRYTQDNWLLSVIAPNLLLARLTALRPWMIVAEGWLAFAAQCLFTSLLARELVGGRIAAWLGAVLLCASPAALGEIGYLAHPVSHGVTSAWSLAGLWLLARHLARGGAWRPAAALCLLLAAGVSDPWARPAFLLPILLAGLAAWVAAGPGPVRRRALSAALVAGAALAAGSSLFGLLGFLPPSAFDLGGLDGLPDRLAVVGRGLATFFPVVPGPGPNWVADDCVLAVILALAGWQAAREARRPDPLRAFVAAWAALSLAATAAAFAASDLPPEPLFARLLVNAYAAIPLLACLAAGRRAPRLLLTPAAGIVVSACLALAWAPPAAGPSRAERLLAFLDAHRLTYGYGGYWSAEANAIGWLSGGRVVVRPVTGVFDGDRPQTFARWYRELDVPEAQRRFFYVAAAEPDVCSAASGCEAEAVRAFGPPEETLRWEDTSVMVWDHALLNQQQDDAAAPPLPPSETVDFSAADARAYLSAGWSEHGRFGVSTIRQRPLVWLPRLASGGPQRVCVRAFFATSRRDPPRPVTVRFGDRTAAEWSVTPASAAYCADNPAGRAALRLEFSAGQEAERPPVFILQSLAVEKLPP